MCLWFSSDYRYNSASSDQITSTTQAQQVSGFVPGWMLWATKKANTVQKGKANNQCFLVLEMCKWWCYCASTILILGIKSAVT